MGWLGDGSFVVRRERGAELVGLVSWKEGREDRRTRELCGRRGLNHGGEEGGFGWNVVVELGTTASQTLYETLAGMYDIEG
jgi:hypothetical protein